MRKLSKITSFAIEGVTFGKIISEHFFLIQLYNLIGMVYGTVGDEINSVQYMLKAYYEAKANKIVRYTFNITNNLGVLFYDLEYYDIAYEYFLESFKERGIRDTKSVNRNDGYNLINLLGCSLHLRKLDEYERWKAYLNVYREQFTDYTVENDYYLYQIYEAYYNRDYQSMMNCIYDFLNYGSLDADQLHTYKNMAQIFRLSVDAGFESISHVLLEQLNIYIKNIRSINGHQDY